MKAEEVKMDFRRLLEDITYTNSVFKTHDVRNVITKQQFYALKDRLVIWLLKHNYTEKSPEGFESFVDRNLQVIELVRIKLKYGDTECLVHQHLDGTICKIFGIAPYEEDRQWDKYCPKKYDIEYDEVKFREAIDRMMMCRMLFMRRELDWNAFQSALATNISNKSNNPWMARFVEKLPGKGRKNIWIVDVNNC